jgi:hypothetical protein
MHRVDHLPPPLDAHRLKVLDKKYRSTISCPILAWSFSFSASLALLAPAVLQT